MRILDVFFNLMGNVEIKHRYSKHSVGFTSRFIIDLMKMKGIFIF